MADIPCRADGTLAYFFAKEDLEARCRAAGFEVLACKYVCVINRNRKSGKEMRRVFVQGRFRRPQQKPAALNDSSV